MTWCVVLGLLVAAGVKPAFAAFDPTNATLAELASWAQVYVSTPEKKHNRDGAREALFARGGESLRFVMQHLTLTNDALRVLAYDMVVHKLPPDESAPVLLEFLDAPDGATRRTAAYFLGFTAATNAAPRLLPLLADELTAGAAARTLGKWREREAVPALIELLASDKELRRIVAANALHDIGDPRAVPALLAALDDPVFTVRKVAARALTALGRPAERALLDALPASEGVARREIVRTLGAMRTARAVRPLRALLRDADGGLRTDIAGALHAIDPARAPRWIRSSR